MLEKGQILNNRYKILEIIKIGSKKAVYTAVDLNLPGKLWIIKEFFPQSIKEENKTKFYKDLQGRAGIMAQMDYISFPFLVDFFICNENYYHIFEYVSGKSLASMINISSEYFFNEESVKEFIFQVIKTSIYFQKNPMFNISIEFKPENIFIDSMGMVKFLDYSISEEPAINKIYSTRFLETIYEKKIENDFVATGMMFSYLMSSGKPVPDLENKLSQKYEKYTCWEEFLTFLSPERNMFKGNFIPVPEDGKVKDDLQEAETCRKKASKNPSSLENNIILKEETLSAGSSPVNSSWKKDVMSRSEDGFFLKPSLMLLLLFSIIIVVIINTGRLSGILPVSTLSDNEVPEQNELLPIKPEGYKNRALYYYNLGDYSRAISLFKRHMLNYPGDGEASIYLSNSYILMEKGEKLYIGLGISATGDDSQVGQAVMQGIAMAIREINSRKGNLKFVIVIKDDNSNPDKAKEVAHSFVEDSKISIVIGHGRSSCTLAAGKIYNEGKLPNISPISTNPVISNMGPYIFRTCGSDISQAKTLSEIARNKLKVKHIAIVCNLYDPYSNSLSSFFKKYSLNNLNIVSQENYSFNETDFTSQILNIINKSPDLVFIAGYDIQALYMIKQLREKGFKGYIMGGDALYTQKMINQGREYVEGLICTTFFHPHISSRESVKFVKDFRKLFGGGTPNPIAAQAYDSIKLISCAVKGSVDRNNLQKNLSEIGKRKTFRGLTGEINFSGQRDSSNWIVVKIHGGKYIPL